MAIKRPLVETNFNPRNVRPRKSLFHDPSYAKNQRENILNDPSIAQQQQDRRDHSRSNRRNRIRFHDMVSVMRIPSRYQYPKEMKRRIWSPMAEIRANAKRNSIEFAAEGWDWRQATEDDAMFVTANGDRIHPVHVKRLDFYPPMH